MIGLTELAAAARVRNDAALERRCARVVGPLKRRVAELEGLLAGAVERGDALAEALAKSEAALAGSKAHVESLRSQLKVSGAQTAKAASAKKKGK